MTLFLRRLSEPSTWAALAALLAVGGVALPAGLAESAAMVFAGLSGVVGVVLPESAR